MDKETVQDFYEVLIENYLTYYSFGFKMLVEEELTELKGAENSLKHFKLDHKLLKEAEHADINLVGNMLDPLMKAIQTLANLNNFPHVQEVVDQMGPSAASADAEDEENGDLLQDLINNMPDYESKSPGHKLFIQFFAFHGTFFSELSELVTVLVNRDAGEPVNLDDGRLTAEEKFKALEPYADTNARILFDMLTEMNTLFKEYIKHNASL